MDDIETELVEDGRRRDTRGRKLVSTEERERLLAAYQESGLRQRAFARRERINDHTLVGWLHRYGRGGRRSLAMPLRGISLCL